MSSNAVNCQPCVARSLGDADVDHTMPLPPQL